MAREKQPKRRLTDSAFLQYAGMGLQILGMIAAGAFGGYYLDKWLEFRFPLFTILLSLAGVTGAMYSIIRKL